LIIVAIVTGLSVGIVMIYFILFQFGVKSSNKEDDQSWPVSIVIAARNEDKNIKTCLDAIIKQDYPEFEIILVDDHSSDETLRIAEGFKTYFPDLKIVQSKNKGKKSAVKTGIQEAQYEYLLFTDADCQPRSSTWIKNMMLYFDENTSIVIGYSPYQFNHSLINYIQQYETLLTACLYISAVHFYRPYMAVGRNLAYRKSVFTKSSQFNTHLNLLSGDDDLLIQEMATRDNTKVCLQPDAFVDSKPKRQLKSFFFQKLRHISTSDHYKWKDKLLLGLFHFARLGIFTGFLLLILWTEHQMLATISLLCYFILLQAVLFRPCKKLGITGIIFYIPVIEVFLVGFHLVLIFYKLFLSKKIKWK